MEHVNVFKVSIRIYNSNYVKKYVNKLIIKLET